jgi:LPS-assembly protein
MRLLITVLVLTYTISIGLIANASPSLIADVITVSADGNVIKAEGNVEISFEKKSLKASTITYNKLTEKINATGPIILNDGKQTLIFADKALLDKELTNAVLNGAKFVLSNSLEITSSKIIRKKGRYNNFYETRASSCKICEKSQTPLWEIRAKKIIHDTNKNEIYFYNSQFRLSGIPIFYFPILRMPDPKIKRANGFLIPEINHSSISGTEIKLPYFLVLDEATDITLKPKFSTNRNYSLGAKYRKLFEKSDLIVDAFAINGDNPSYTTRGYLFANFNAKFNEEKYLSMQYQRTSDINLIADHTKKDLNLTENFIKLKQQTGFFYGDTNFYQTNLQGTSIVDLNSPNLNNATRLNYVFYPKKLGGQAQLLMDARAYQRDSTEDGVLGRDSIGAKVDLSWKKKIISKSGLVLNIESLTTTKLAKYYNDSQYQNAYSQISQISGIDLGFPLIKKNNEFSTTIEPTIQLIYSAPSFVDNPNEDSNLSELSTSNFSDLNHSYGLDQTENGLRLQTGLKTSYRTKAGMESDIFFGNIYRINGENNFSEGSGLNGVKSNFIGALKFNVFDKFKINAGVITNDKFKITRNELQLNYDTNDNFNIYSRYFKKNKDELLGFTDDRSELNVGLNYKMNRNIITNIDFVYDMDRASATKSKLNSRYEHDCLALDVFVARDFYSAGSTNSGISIGLKFELTGFNAVDKLNKSKKCNG